MLKKALVALAALSVILLVSASVDVFYIHDAATGTLAWNSQQAYVFMDVVSFGYRMSYLKFIAEIPLEFLGDIPLPNDKHFSAVVVEVFPEAGRRIVKQNVNLESYTIFDGKLFAGDLEGAPGSLWAWSGNGFRLATATEKTAFYDSQRHNPQAQDVTDVEGWSKRTVECSDVSDFPIRVGGKDVTLARGCGVMGSVESIELRSPGQRPQTIWNLPDGFRWVSRPAYQQSFEVK
jgi:hypothetical protein